MGYSATEGLTKFGIYQLRPTFPTFSLFPLLPPLPFRAPKRSCLRLMGSKETMPGRSRLGKTEKNDMLTRFGDVRQVAKNWQDQRVGISTVSLLFYCFVLLSHFQCPNETSWAFLRHNGTPCKRKKS
jgi:hypothetical protein